MCHRRCIGVGSTHIALGACARGECVVVVVISWAAICDHAVRRFVLPVVTVGVPPHGAIDARRLTGLVLVFAGGAVDAVFRVLLLILVLTFVTELACYVSNEWIVELVSWAAV